MKKEITIIIPAVKALDQSGVINSYLASPVREELFVQFVYLTNKRQIGERAPSDIRTFEDHEILHVTNDRYFGSCEENVYRVQDFLGLFKRHVFCVGEHDIVDWDVLLGALKSFENRGLEAMGWNILVKQLKKDDSYASQLSILLLDEKMVASDYVKLLLSGHVLNASVAYPALLSVYGPIDWAAYIGNHLFTRETFAKILQYKFTEHVYSFVYKQAAFFSTHKINYGFYMNPVIHRVSEDFVKLNEGTHSLGWLEDHRTVQGASPTFWIANLSHLVQLQDDALFNALSLSLCLSQSPGEDGNINVVRYTMISNLFAWSRAVIQHKLSGRSHYFPDAAGSASLQDIRYVQLYFERLLNAMASSPEVYGSLSPNVARGITEALQFLRIYFDTYMASSDLLRLASERINSSFALFTHDDLVMLNQASFQQWMNVSA